MAGSRPPMNMLYSRIARRDRGGEVSYIATPLLSVSAAPGLLVSASADGNICTRHDATRSYNIVHGGGSSSIQHTTVSPISASADTSRPPGSKLSSRTARRGRGGEVNDFFTTSLNIDDLALSGQGPVQTIRGSPSGLGPDDTGRGC